MALPTKPVDAISGSGTEGEPTDSRYPRDIIINENKDVTAAFVPIIEIRIAASADDSSRVGSAPKKSPK